MVDLVDELIKYVATEHPRSLTGAHEALESGDGRFRPTTERLLSWLVTALGPDAVPRSVEAFVRFSTDVNLHQARYEARGTYESKTYSDVLAHHYSDVEAMSDYLLGVYLTNVLWAHHMDITTFFFDRFVARLAPAAHLIEFAFGHGAWGLQALAQTPGAELRGFDISPAARQLATKIAAAAGLGHRSKYYQGDALDPTIVDPASADGVICCFLVEHLEQPSMLADAVARTLKPGSRAFLTGALTAAQCDHIYEFQKESELVEWCERAGLRVIETLSVNPRRLLRNARFVPRSMALVVERSILR